MTSISQNQAAWLQAENKDLVVGPGPDQSTPADDEVVIKASYVAINPVDWKLQENNFFSLPLPFVLGEDIAGEIVLTGANVTRFKKGDRVIGHCLGISYGGSKHNAFQSFVTCRERSVSPVSDSLDLSRAVVLPLAISTSISAMYDILDLRLPSVGEVSPTHGTIVIWGASSSVGTAAIQLARAAGYEVIGVASARNFAYVRALGCSEVFDYNDTSVQDQIHQHLAKTKLAGVIDCVSQETSTKGCAEILSRQGGGLFAMVLPPPDDLPEGVTAKGCFATTAGTVEGHAGEKIWKDFVPAALASGQLQAKPDPIIIEGGLAKIQEGMTLLKKGVSAAKVVIKID